MSGAIKVLERMDRGDPKAAEELLPLVYSELRQLAALHMAQQPAGHTLQATALVHEAYLKLVGGERTEWRDRRHFFASAAEAMRQILVDRARRRRRLRHGANAEHLRMQVVDFAVPESEEILLELNEALTELERVSPQRAEIVNLRFFAGLSERDIAGLLGISERSVQRQWRYARAWLFECMETGRVERI